TFPMAGKSVFVDGNRSDGVYFQMKTEIAQDFKLENAQTGFRIDSSDTAAKIFFIGFHLHRWFDGVDLNAPDVSVATGADGNPMIPINQDTNQSLQEGIQENIKFSSDLFEDSDGNDHLDLEEQREPLAEGMPAP